MTPPRVFISLAWAAALAASPTAHAQVTRADYQRADALRDRGRDAVIKARVEPHWVGDGARFWYRNDLHGGAKEYVAVDAERGIRRPAFDHGRLAAALAKAAGSPQKADTLALDIIAFETGGVLVFDAGGKTWRYDPEADTVVPAKKPAQPAQPPAEPRGRRRRGGSPRAETSPDGKSIVAARDHNLTLRRAGTTDAAPVTFDGIPTNSYENGVYWSPDSRRFVALRHEKGDDRRVTLVESSPRDQLQPKVRTYDYLKPGDRVPVSRPRLFDATTRREIPIDETLYPNPWSIEDVRWSPDSSHFTFVYNQRGHQVLRVIAVDAATGKARAVVDERSKTFIDYAHKQFVEFLDSTHELVWMTERNGWNHLVLIDTATGAVKNPITTGEWVVRGVDRVDHEKRQVWFRAGGIRPGQDPYQVHHARVNLDGTGLVVLTEGDGNHEVRFSPDRRYLIDTYSRVDLPPVTELRRADDGSLVCRLEEADVSALAARGWRPPVRFVARGRDGTTDIHGVIYPPARLDPFRTYPVIEQIYAGPQGAFVPKRFDAVHRAERLTELGFAVVQIDGMGTNWRSKAFHDVCWKNLADAGFPDRIAWMKAAAEAFPYLDLSRVGVYGGSAGGQNALGALLFHGEFYKAAAADCGCHDNRMDKVWWNELWMGWPIGPHYAEQSNAVNAHRLKGKLLLTVGEADENVDPASTMQVVNALIRARKDFELVVFPGGGHGSGSSPYGERRLRDFFVRHLLKCQPPDWNGEADESAASPGAGRR
jgi:dipeptidyl aminopeptidase/acylaminoacyl peptidase